MPRAFLSPLVVASSSSDPSTTTAGAIYYNSGSNELRYYNGTAWTAISTVSLTNPAITGSITTGSTSFDLINTTATTVNFAGAATTLNVATSATGAVTANLVTGVTASGSTKTVNIGTGGVSGSTTNVTIGSTAGTSTVTVNNALATSSTSFDLINTTATTVNFAGAATSLTIGATTATTTLNFGTGLTGSSNSKTINIGTGTAGSSSNVDITIGPTNGTGTISIGNSNRDVTYNFGAVTTSSGFSKTINIGTGSPGSSTSSTTINVGPSTSFGTRLLNLYGTTSISNANKDTNTLTITGTSSQTGFLQEWLNSASTSMASMSTSGLLTVVNLTVGSLTGYLKGTSGSVTATANVAASDLSGTVAVANGGTGASTAANARTNLGLGTASSVTFDSIVSNTTIEATTKIFLNSSSVTATNTTSRAIMDVTGFGMFARDNGTPLFIHRTGVTAGTADGDAIVFYRAGSLMGGKISISNSTTMAYTTTSDYRLKRNVRPVSDPIATIEALNPVEFNFVGQEATVVGFVAHELQEIVPSAVVGEKDAIDKDGNPAYQSVDNSFVVPVLAAGLKAALDKIAQLEARLDAAGV